MKVMVEPHVNNKHRRRVLLALDAANSTLETLEFAAFLAVELEAKLQGLFVEDADLLQVAELPFTREVVLFSAQERRFEGGALDRSLKIVAKRVQMELARVAEGARLSWSFETVRGRRIPLLLEVGATSDVLIVARPRQKRWRPESGDQLSASRGVIYLVYIDTPSAEHALITALVLARQKGRQLVVLVPQEGKGQTSLAVRAAGRLAELQPQASVREMAFPMGVENLCKQSGGEAIILPADMPEVQDPVWFQSLLDKVRCPLVLVR